MENITKADLQEIAAEILSIIKESQQSQTEFKPEHKTSQCYGTFSGDILDTLKTDISIVNFGEDQAWEAIKDYLDIYNTIAKEAIAEYADISEKRQYTANGTKIYDSFGNHIRTENATILGIPLFRTDHKLPFNRDYIEECSCSTLRQEFLDLLDEDAKRKSELLKDVIFTPTNRLDYQDALVDHFNIPCYAFANGDEDSKGHNHYLVAPELNSDAIRKLITEVVEHDGIGTIKICINRKSESAVWSMVGSFYPYIPVDFNGRNSLIKPISPSNKAIGMFDLAEVWVKPWVPEGYLCVIGEKSSGRKALGARWNPLIFRSIHEHFPLRASKARSQMGLGIKDRFLGACMQITKSNVYTAPETTYNLNYGVQIDGKTVDPR